MAYINNSDGGHLQLLNRYLSNYKIINFTVQRTK